MLTAEQSSEYVKIPNWCDDKLFWHVNNERLYSLQRIYKLYTSIASYLWNLLTKARAEICIAND